MPKKTVPPGNSKLQLNEHEKAWEKERLELYTWLRASGLTVTEKAPPKGTAPLMATFHLARLNPTRGDN